MGLGQCGLFINSQPVPPLSRLPTSPFARALIQFMMIKQFASLLEARKRLLPALEANSKERDSKGSSTNLLGLSHRFIGVAEFASGGDVEAFRRELTASGRCQLELLVRFDEGGDVSPSFAAMTGGKKALLDALAAGNYGLSLELAQRIGGRETVEKRNDHPFDLAFGYALKAAVLESEDLGERVSAFAAEVVKQGNRDFAGYADALALVVSGDIGNPQPILAKIVEGHRSQSKGKGVFKGSEDEALSVWGVGIANLLISKGGLVNFDDPLIPRALLSHLGE